MDKSIVSIVRTERNPSYEKVREAVNKAIDLIGGISDVVKPGQLVLINPNLVALAAGQEAAAVTSPDICRALVDIARERGARAVIAESSAVGVDTEKVIAGSGYQQLRDLGYDVVDLKKDKKMIMLPVSKGKVFDKIQSYPLVQEADVIISVPKLKTHDQVEITCAIKNLKGLESDAHKRKTHQIGLVAGIVDLMTVIKPNLAIVDGIIGMEGLAPIYGKPVEMNLIIASRDLVATDAVCGRIIGYEPGEVRVTVEAAGRGLGNMHADKIEVVGESVKSVYRRFLRAAEDNPVQVEDFNLVSGDETCTGCRNTVLSALNDMRTANQLEYLHGITVITGKAAIPPGVSPETVVAVGNCVPKERRGNHFVPGCPPNNALVVDAILGGRAKAKRMYAEGNLEETEKN